MNRRLIEHYQRDIDYLRMVNAELLEALKHAQLMLEGLSTDGEITMTPEGKDRITAELRKVIAKAEA